VTQGTARSGDSAARYGLLLAGAIVLLFAARFWFHDVFPYIAEYTEASYRRFWPQRYGLLLHVIGGSLALFTGPFQLWSGLRKRLRTVHRWLGYAYMTGVAMASLGSFYLAFFARPDFGVSLFIMAIVWCLTIGMALMAIKSKRIDAHREWMVRSYIVTFSFVSYRYLVKLPLLEPLGGGLVATVLWASWVVPMMVYETASQWNRARPLKRPIVTRADATSA
jgi:uncharacterized membrane protein